MATAIPLIFLVAFVAFSVLIQTANCNVDEAAVEEESAFVDDSEVVGRYTRHVRCCHNLRREGFYDDQMELEDEYDRGVPFEYAGVRNRGEDCGRYDCNRCESRWWWKDDCRDS